MLDNRDFGEVTLLLHLNNVFIFTEKSMKLKGKYNPVTGKKDIPEPKEKKPRGRPVGYKPKKKPSKGGRPMGENYRSREKQVFIVEPIKKEEEKIEIDKNGVPKRVSMRRPDSIKHLIGRPKKVLTPEEIAEREERQRQRLETTALNRVKEYAQPWHATPLKFRNKVDEYFDVGAHTYTIKKGDEEITQKLYTWTGLALYLGFSSRPSMVAFGKKNREFKEILEKALLRVEMGYEEKLHSSNPTGAIFALKNSIYGWTDNTKPDVNVNVNVFEKLMKQASQRKLPENITMVEDG